MVFLLFFVLHLISVDLSPNQSKDQVNSLRQQGQGLQQGPLGVDGMKPTFLNPLASVGNMVCCIY